MKYSHTSFWALAFLCISAYCSDEPIQKNAQESYTFTHAITDDDAIFKDSLQITSASPDVQVVSWHTTTPAQKTYEPSFKTYKETYTNELPIELRLKKEGTASKADIVMQFRTRNVAKPQEKRFPINLENSTSADTTAPTSKQEHPEQTISLATAIEHKLAAIKESVFGLVSSTQSTTTQLILVFLLGLLMSLTPCIYPMIPVTVGILQTSASSSLLGNFALAFSYTSGMATTFALLGLLAATGSAQFGALLGNPWFVLFLVLFLGYLAFSMLGFYEMYTPRFMTRGAQGPKGGSFISTFFFGIISGSVASPCLSPGLVLLLSIVATFASKLLGFVYLFVFGMGLGLPLLIIGTFSNSMNMLPSAGLWMLEVKKFFGFMLLSMCFYYLSAILPLYIILWLVGFTLFSCSFCYLMTIQPYNSRGLRWYKYIMGVLLIALSFVVFFHAYKSTVFCDEEASITIASNYCETRDQAAKEGKLLLVDFGAAWCSSCKAIEKRLIKNPEVLNNLGNIAVVKVDCTNPSAPCCADVQKTFNIVGFPTMLLIEPKEETVLKRWSGELVDLSASDFLRMLKTYQ